MSTIATENCMDFSGHRSCAVFKADGLAGS